MIRAGGEPGAQETHGLGRTGRGGPLFDFGPFHEILAGIFSFFTDLLAGFLGVHAGSLIPPLERARCGRGNDVTLSQKVWENKAGGRF